MKYTTSRFTIERGHFPISYATARQHMMHAVWVCVPRGYTLVWQMHDSYEAVPIHIDVELWADLANGPPPNPA